MISKNLYINIFSRAILLCGTLLATCWLLIKHEYLSTCILGGLAILQVLLLVKFLNTTNRKIAYFFESLRNEDATIFFSETVKNKALQELNQSLNLVNKMVNKAKADVIEKEQFYHTILEQIGTGVISINANQHIVLANKAAKKLLGVSHLSHLNHIKRHHPLLYAYCKETQDGNQRSVKVTVKNELEEREIQSWVSLVRILTHEIANSATPIASLSSNLIEDFQASNNFEPDITLKSLQLIQERGIALVKFVGAYRNYSQIPKPILKRFSLLEFVEKLYILSHSYNPEDTATVTWKIEPEDLMLYADESQITQVMLNIIKNSLHACSNVTNPKVDIAAILQPDESILITITDNGVGIAPDILDKIFIPFYTTKPDGSGIGLSLGKQIMLAHGGNIHVESKENSGTIVSLIF